MLESYANILILCENGNNILQSVCPIHKIELLQIPEEVRCRNAETDVNATLVL